MNKAEKPLWLIFYFSIFTIIINLFLFKKSKVLILASGPHKVTGIALGNFFKISKSLYKEAVEVSATKRPGFSSKTIFKNREEGISSARQSINFTRRPSLLSRAAA